MFLWKHVLNNEKLHPVPPGKQSPPLVDMTSKDKWTVTFHFAEPAPWAYYNMALSKTPLSEAQRVYPSHFMKQYHPKFAARKKLKQQAEKKGIKWSELYTRMEGSHMHPEYAKMRPTLKKYIAVKRTVSSIILERNPYYPFIDPEGNQLPYIDRIRVDLANNRTMAESKAATGEATFTGRTLKVESIPLYKKYGERSGYRTIVYRRLGTNCIAFNINHRDASTRRIFSDLRFRKAMSLAIRRKDINRKLYFNKADPRQATAVTGIDPMFEERHARKYAEYKPDKARKLLVALHFGDLGEKAGIKSFS